MRFRLSVLSDVAFSFYSNMSYAVMRDILTLKFRRTARLRPYTDRDRLVDCMFSMIF